MVYQKEKLAHTKSDWGHYPRSVFSLFNTDLKYWVLTAIVGGGMIAGFAYAGQKVMEHDQKARMAYREAQNKKLAALKKNVDRSSFQAIHHPQGTAQILLSFKYRHLNWNTAAILQEILRKKGKKETLFSHSPIMDVIEGNILWSRRKKEGHKIGFLCQEHTCQLWVPVKAYRVPEAYRKNGILYKNVWDLTLELDEDVLLSIQKNRVVSLKKGDNTVEFDPEIHRYRQTYLSKTGEKLAEL